MTELTKKNLETTIPMMTSEDYRERFRAEFYQLHARYEALCEMLYKWDCGELNFEPKSDYFLLREQKRVMQEYLSILVDRAEVEDIDISLMAG